LILISLIIGISYFVSSKNLKEELTIEEIDPMNKLTTTDYKNIDSVVKEALIKMTDISVQI